MENMMIITSNWKNHETFKLIPISNDCPYIEAIYDRELKVLAVINKVKKQQFHMVPKVDANGDVEMRKNVKSGQTQNPYKEERRSIETFQEYYIEDESEIKDFLKMFAVNFDSYNTDSYFGELPPMTEQQEFMKKFSEPIKVDMES
jgi:hypothetical protein